MFLRDIIVILFEKGIEGKMLGVILQLFEQALKHWSNFPQDLKAAPDPIQERGCGGFGADAIALHVIQKGSQAT